MSFQIILIIALSLIALGAVVTLIRGVMPKLSLAVLLAALLACAAAIWRPDATTLIARSLGLDTSTHLLLYCTIFVMMAGFFLFYVRLRQLRQELTVMVRHVAMLEAVERPGTSGGDSSGTTNESRGR